MCASDLLLQSWPAGQHPSPPDIPAISWPVSLGLPPPRLLHGEPAVGERDAGTAGSDLSLDLPPVPESSTTEEGHM